MRFTIEIEVPDPLGSYLKEQWGNVPQRLLELAAVQGYRTQELSAAQVGRILGLDGPLAVDAFLKRQKVYDHQTLEEHLAGINKPHEEEDNAQGTGHTRKPDNDRKPRESLRERLAKRSKEKSTIKLIEKTSEKVVLELPMKELISLMSVLDAASVDAGALDTEITQCTAEEVREFVERLSDVIYPGT